jgi:predicted nucleic acid-binding Zn ribbon protein
LSEWRRIDLRSAEAARRKAERPIADIMGGVLKHIRIDQRQSESQVVAVWKQVIDPAVVAHARPVNLAKGTLFVSVDSSPWLAEIVRYRSREILERLQLAVGKDIVQRISFRIG